jgi:ethanolamine utilization protein EutQ (cupin superfamily)
MTQERGSQIGTETYIPATTQGTNVRNVIISIVTAFSDFKRYDVCEFESDMPYDLTFNIGSYPVDMLNQILNLFPYYEMFYDENGIFTVQKIPTKVSDPVDIDKETIDDLLISVSKINNFSEIRNTTEIWGKEVICDYTAMECETVNGVYNVTIGEAFTALVDGESYSVIPDQDSVVNQKMDIQNLGEYFIYTANGDGTYNNIGFGDMKQGVPYSLRYTDQKYVLEGELQVRCIVQEIVEQPSASAMQSYIAENACNNVQWVVNPDSTYGCRLEPTTGKIIGEMKQVLSGDEYQDIYTTTLAFERARYENWKKCRLQDTIEIELILIPWIDVNQKIQFTSPISNQVETWIVQTINFNFETWTMNVTASRFYPYYPWDE